MSSCVVQVLLPDGNFGPERIYTLPPDRAVVAASQADQGNMNTWQYPTPEKAGVRPSSVLLGVVLLDVGDRCYAGFPEET